MLARLGASLKGAIGSPLNVADLANIMGASLTNPEKLLGQLFGSVLESWKQVSIGDASGFTDHWRTNHFLPYLASIAAQPTTALQRWNVTDLLLADQEGMTTAAETLNLPAEQAAAFLAQYPSSAAAQKPFTWKRDSVGLDLGFHLLNTMALLHLAQKAYGLNSDELQSWSGLYGNAYNHVFRLQVILRTLHVIAPEMSDADAQQVEAAGRPYLQKLQTILAGQRDDIANGRSDEGRFRSAYNQMVDVKFAYLENVIGTTPTQREYI
jgi:hypothetical protein